MLDNTGDQSDVMSPLIELESLLANTRFSAFYGGTIQALKIMKFRESGDQDNGHEGNSEEVVIKIMITQEIPRKW